MFFNQIFGIFTAMFNLQLAILLLINTALGILSASSCESPQYLEQGKVGTLECEFDEDFSDVLWYNSSDYVNNDPILHLSNSVITGPGYDSFEFDVNMNGSLIISNVLLKHEGIFTAAYIHTQQEGPVFMQISVIVIVLPMPAYPVIEGCNYEQYCELEVEQEGNLTCTVKGIRPLVQLEWKTFSDSEADLISVTNQPSIVNDNGETFDISVILTYDVSDKSLERLKLECKAPESDEVFNLTSTIDLIFKETSDSDDVLVVSFIIWWIACYVAGVVIAVIVFVAVSRRIKNIISSWSIKRLRFSRVCVAFLFLTIATVLILTLVLPLNLSLFLFYLCLFLAGFFLGLCVLVFSLFRTPPRTPRRQEEDQDKRLERNGEEPEDEALTSM